MQKRGWWQHYKAYLRSAAWRERRATALARAGYRCERCGNKRNPLHAHHKTYVRLGNEQPDDLEVLCSPCHRSEHRKLKPRPKRKKKITMLEQRKPRQRKASLVEANDQLHTQLVANRKRRERARRLREWSS